MGLSLKESRSKSLAFSQVKLGGYKRVLVTSQACPPAERRPSFVFPPRPMVKVSSARTIIKRVKRQFVFCFSALRISACSFLYFLNSNLDCFSKSSISFLLKIDFGKSGSF